MVALISNDAKHVQRMRMFGIIGNCTITKGNTMQ